ncbi:MAG: DEAD/DEAH box helicase family protein [Syntrophobacteraceae bacterium]
MDFKFNPNQEFQLQAIQAVTDLFSGQPLIPANLQFVMGISMIPAVQNRLDLEEADLLQNLKIVQAGNQISLDSALAPIEETISANGGEESARFYNFPVEMETGTGKTYVYLRTALELFRQYGYRKFIVVVPSIAIREGVLKTFQITAKHLRDLYDNTPYHFYVYDSASRSQVRHFAQSNSVEFMVMTLDAFNKASNVIRQSSDRLQGEKPIHFIRAARPILILDEPQNMESEKSIAALAILKPLFALRYSATHRNPYNLVYRLTPFEAYRQRLIKRIEVASVLKEGDTVLPFLRLDKIEVERRTIKAKLRVHKLTANGSVKEASITVKPGDPLEAKTGRKIYAGFVIDEINPGGKFIRFANTVELRQGEETGSGKEAIFESQIRYAIEEHFQKQARLRDQGIKVLTLFFIDRVDNYAKADGILRILFNRLFEELKQKYPDWKDIQPEEVQAAYFAQRRTRTGEIILEDSKTGEAEKDEEAYNLIMKKKETLLSFDEPVCFIFSHSALREGWDNPNVFQICTLNQTASEVKKRQEVGRGVRLAVNQDGDRIEDERVNILTVVANESYENFVSQLQSEIAFEFRSEIEAKFGKSIADLSDEDRARIEEEYGKGILPPRPKNARLRKKAAFRKEFILKLEFQELWERIKHKTRYSVRIDSGKLIGDVSAELNRIEVKPPRVTILKAIVNVSEEGAFEALQMSGAKSVMDLSGRYPLPNLVELMTNLLEFTTPKVCLTRRTILAILNRLVPPAQKQFIENPNEFATQAVAIIKAKLADQLIEGIQYEKINEWYEMTQFEDIEAWEDYLVPSPKRSAYDYVACDSNPEVEFVEGLESMDFVKLYVKLPSWFTVPTPIGTYNPDWAIVIEDRDEHGNPTGKPCLYLVRETKDKTDLSKLRPDEKRKIACGRSHFIGALGVDFKVVTSANDLPDGGV